MNTNAGSNSLQRFTRHHPCPVCGGYDQQQRGESKRCYGFLSRDGQWAHCTRPEYAGSLQPKDGSNTYAHRLHGRCACGVQHGPDVTRPNRKSKQQYEIRDEHGRVVCIHERTERPDGSKKFLWLDADGTIGLKGRKRDDVPLYGIHRVKDRPDELVILVEGEKAADALTQAGRLAVATVTGADGTPTLDVLRPLTTRDVYLWADNDDIGHRHMERILRRLQSLSITARTIMWNDAPPKGDAFDFIQTCGSNGALDALLIAASAAGAESVATEDKTEIEPVAIDVTPELPSYAAIDDALAAMASPWLDNYTDFSRQWSPQSFDGFHEAVALWLLSTVAARRVVLHYGGELYTNIYIALCARTSLYAKSTVAGIARQVLSDAGIIHLLAADDATPQAFLRNMTLRVHDGYADAPQDRKDLIQQRLTFAAQRGWFYDEFGQKLHAMMQNAGTMVDFRGHLRRLDDCPSTYEYVTVSRGSDMIEDPYLALLANLTPADLRPHAKRGSALWGDGFLARFGLIAPPADHQMEVQDFPDGIRIIPQSVLGPLRVWHERLGSPSISIVERRNEKGDGTGAFDVERTPPRIQRCEFGDGVRAAVSSYRKALHEVMQDHSENTDLDGNYARLHIKALRVAMLLASLENGGRIELRHWARAQQIAERWRTNLHQLVAQLVEDEPSRERTAEDRILAFLQKQTTWVTPRVVSQYVKGFGSAEIKSYLERMAAAGSVEAQATAQTTKYRAVIDKRCRSVDGVEVLKKPKNVYTFSSNGVDSPASEKGVEENKGISTPSTPLHLQHPTQSKPTTGHEAIRAVREAIRQSDFTSAGAIMRDFPIIDWSEEEALMKQVNP